MSSHFLLTLLLLPILEGLSCCRGDSQILVSASHDLLGFSRSVRNPTASHWNLAKVQIIGLQISLPKTQSRNFWFQDVISVSRGEKGRRGDRFRMGYDQGRECRRSTEVNGRGFWNTDMDHYTTARFKGMKEGKGDSRGLPEVKAGKPESNAEGRTKSGKPEVMCRRPGDVR
ncbi:hypothetical protein K438DRAFT_1939388 [Mycena galopus ATCC 62051]|nr:hypothetical protein K438DRAFT_1939388 [Mycena galopus ATCC 62051]